LLGGFLFHAIEVTFERVDMRGPKAPERREPGVNLSERFWSDAVHAPLRVDSRFDEAGFAQHSEMLGDRRLRHPQLMLELADRAL
jgi:hypothetical protein